MRLTLAALALVLAQGGGDALRVALKDIDTAPGWIYNDLGAGFAEAKMSGKPLLVVFR